MARTRDNLLFLRGAARESDNPVELLLTRRLRQRGDDLLRRPALLWLAALVWTVLTLITLRQFWMLSRLPHDLANPLYIESARLTALNATLLLCTTLLTLILWARILTALRDSLALLGGSAGAALHLGDLLRGAPLAARDIAGGLLRHHLHLMMWPALLLGLLSLPDNAVQVADRLFDAGLSGWQPDYLTLPLLPLPLGLLWFLLTAWFCLSGICIGARQRNVILQYLTLLGWLPLGLLLLGGCLVGLEALLELCGIVIAAPAMLWAQFLTIDISLGLQVLLLWHLAQREIRLRQSGGSEHSPDPHRSGSSDGPDRQRSRWPVLALLALQPLLAIALYCYSSGFSYSLPSSGDALYDWYYGYCQATMQQRHMDPPVINEPTDNPANAGQNGILNGVYYDHALMREAESRFGEDPRWQLLRYELLKHLESSRETPEADRLGVETNAEAARLLLEQFVESAPAAPACEFHLLELQWDRISDGIEDITYGGVGPWPLSADIFQQRDELLQRFREFAIRSNEAWPAYWLAAEYRDLDHAGRMELVELGNSLPCSTLFPWFNAGLISAELEHPVLSRDRILAGTQAFREDFYIHRITLNPLGAKELCREAVAGGDAGEIDALHRMSVRTLACEELGAHGRLVNVVLFSILNREFQPGGSLASRSGPDFDEYMDRLRALKDSVKQNSMMMSDSYDMSAMLEWQQSHVLPFHVSDNVVMFVIGLENELCHGRAFSRSFAFEMNSTLDQLLASTRWIREHRSEVLQLQDFDFETLSWREESDVAPAEP